MYATIPEDLWVLPEADHQHQSVLLMLQRTCRIGRQVYSRFCHMFEFLLKIVSIDLSSTSLYRAVRVKDAGVRSSSLSVRDRQFLVCLR